MFPPSLTLGVPLIWSAPSCHGRTLAGAALVHSAGAFKHALVARDGMMARMGLGRPRAQPLRDREDIRGEAGKASSG
ncbi:MAG: hypothetical protein H0T80_13900 [Betaproteobacteria bacterium]|nr:hypothetical protein [Betaproteobacteria bacterium]